MTPKIAALLDQGLASHKAGDPAAAVICYDAVLKEQPSQPDALWLKGVAMLHLGEARAAVGLVKRASELRPADADILNDLGAAQDTVGDYEDALVSFQSALNMKPGDANLLISVARCHFRIGDHLSAVECADRVIIRNPTLSDAHNIRALALKGLGRLKDALSAFDQALKNEPDKVIFLVNKAELQRVMGDCKGAVEILKRAKNLSAAGSADWANATTTLGLVLAKAGRVRPARDCYDEVLGLIPSHFETLNNRGELSQAEGDVEAAERDYQTALSIIPSAADTQYNVGRLRLLQQNWNEGWDLFERRWETTQLVGQNRSGEQPVWDGNLSSDANLVVWGEQGLGDQILFASQIPDLVSQKHKISLEIDPRLKSLFQRSFPSLEVYGYDDAEILRMPRAKQVAMGSLGRYLRRSVTDFPQQQSFLKADPDVAHQLRERYVQQAQGRKVIGIAWHSINPTFGLQKSLPLEHWGVVLAHHPQVLFVSLQYGDVVGAVRRAAEAAGADILVDSDVDPIADFDRAAAQIQAMDLVIATSNTAVHVAGALGVPAWVMVPKVPEWRWGLEGDSIPWYETVRVYRQKVQGEWTSVLTALDGDLKNYLSN